MMRVTLFFLLAINIATAFSQDLFVPRDAQAAFDAGTRQSNGLPGKNYWQNRARYAIQISALPPDRTVRGQETIVYVNNSPDTLHAIIFKLFLNIHKPGAPRNFGVIPDYLTDGVHVDSFTIGGSHANFPGNPRIFTNAGVRLQQPLMPHDSVQMSVSWHYTISLQSGREGMIDSTTYFLAYFYPRVAVYDDVSGWDQINFMDSHEFYSDFNDYDVTIEVPRNYIVWGTGTLLTARDVLQPPFFSRYDESLRTDQTIHVASHTDLASHAVTNQRATNKWRFTCGNIPDVAFAISDHFNWDAGSVIVDSMANRRASVQAAYNDTAADFHSMVDYGKHALAWFSRNWPGVPYPYEKSTIVQGYAGMEYPMMVNDETYEDTLFSRFVAEHEIAHTYMPFYMGINETRYGFMDEGWATTFEHLIGLFDLGPERAIRAYRNFRTSSWARDKSGDEQIPIITPGDALTGAGFGNNEYGKASLGYLAVKDILGDELFKKSLQEYMRRWNGKHPIPWDYFNSINAASGKNLNWFWNNWFFGRGYIDLAIKEVKHSGNEEKVTIENIGGLAAPADLIIHYKDGSTITQHLAPTVWEKDQRTVIVGVPAKKKIQSLTLDDGIFHDADPSNNLKELN